MSDVAIRAEGLGKRYRIGAPQARYRTLRETLTNMANAPLTRPHPTSQRSNADRANDGHVWALKDVSFEVKRGEVVGIIGRNGAGKSTLLKILSRITEPTEGTVDLYGRVGSLLEVGTGFHPELTGRENIYLNGAILGMKRAEIERRFDEIVAFAEVEKFVDTPVKRYSSGMYLRLAFAVAAHLDPDILLVDEVLAVGDAAFQKKCLGKMEQVSHAGRTVLFVSHNMAAVRMLCAQSILLEEGRVACFGDTGTVIHHYSGRVAAKRVSQGLRLVDFGPIRIGRDNTGSVGYGEPFEVRCDMHLQSSLPSFILYCIIEDSEGNVLVHARTDNLELRHLNQPGTHEVIVSFPVLWLKPGVYSVHFKLIGSTLAPGRARFVSDSAMLDVRGDVPPETLLGSIAPSVQWAATEACAPEAHKP